MAANPPRRRESSVPPVIREPRWPADGDRIIELFEESARWHAERWPRDIRTSSLSGLREQLPRLADTDDSRCMRVAVIGDEVVGLITAWLSPPPDGGLTYYAGPVVHIGDVVVTASFRRQGLGDRLMAEVERWAVARGAATITLSMHAGNEPAETLYRRRGYRATDTTMRKDL